MKAKDPTKTLPQPEALSHVLYEMVMLQQCLVLSVTPQASAVLRNIYLEGFLFHARCLREFLSPDTKSNSDDIRPEYFGVVPQANLTADLSYKRMHKEIAHLSHTRKSEPSEKEWKVATEFELLRPYCLSFLLEAEKHAEWLSFEDNQARITRLISVFQPTSVSAYRLKLAEIATSTSTTTTLKVTMTGMPDHTDLDSRDFQIL